jgi:membrane associated rhomboid family serine protease
VLDADDEHGNNGIGAMIIPLSHENLRGRRWPWITIGLIVLNAIVFLCTNGRMEQQMAETGQVEMRILFLGAQYPDAQLTPAAKDLIAAIRLQYPAQYHQLVAKFQDEADQAARGGEGLRRMSPLEADAEMAQLCAQLSEAQHTSIAWNYAFHPVDAKPWSYITASFLHGGWLHIIFNMWFLWLAGTILEDLWGRIVYPIFYLVAGALAWAVHGVVFPHSLIPALGASGAIAGLMGAFLARFPNTQIRLGWWFFIRLFKFNVPAYVILPLWLAIQVFWGVLFRSAGAEGGIAYWAHIGGFAFGALGAVLLRATGIEQSADRAIEAKVSWSADPRIVRATEALGENNPAGAIFALRELVKEKPDSVDGWELLLTAQHQKHDREGEKETLAAIVRLRCASGDLEGAWQSYVEYKNLGGAKLPRGVWLEICRHLEHELRWDVAAEEYENLAHANAGERAGVSALVSAGRIYAENLFKPEHAEKLLKEAAASRAPHSDLDRSIQEGLKLCAAAVSKPGAYGR